MEEPTRTPETNKQKPSFLLTEQEEKQYQERSEEKALARKQQYKKWAIFTLMGLVFLGCMYLLFGGNTTEEDPKKDINELVPQAKENVLPSDKEFENHNFQIRNTLIYNIIKTLKNSYLYADSYAFY